MTATLEIKYTIIGWHPSFAPDVARLCQAFSDESLKEYGLEVEQDRLDQMIEVCKDISYFLVVEGKPVGVIAGLIVNNLTNGKSALQEVIWYVDREYRSHGKALMEAFEEAARARGCDSIVMALMCNSMSDRLDKFYKRLGFRPFEVQYIKELSDGR
jgi:GNAT superfamily N-acetyltransferase